MYDRSICQRMNLMSPTNNSLALVRAIRLYLHVICIICPQFEVQSMNRGIKETMYYSKIPIL